MGKQAVFSMFGDLAHLIGVHAHCLCMFNIEFPFKALICGQIWSIQFHPCNRNPFCAYTVCRSTCGRQKLKLGLCIKKGVLEENNKGLNLELFWIWVLQQARHHRVEYFFKEVYVEIRKPWLPCYLRLTDTVRVLWLTLFSTTWSTIEMRGGGARYNYCTRMGLWPAEAIRPQRRVTKLVSVGFSTGRLALVPHCIVLCFLCYPVKLVRLNNTTITSTDCRLMLMLVMILMIPITMNRTLAELCHISWGM